MSAPNPLPLPRDQLITNVEIMEITGFNLNRVNLLKSKPQFPSVICFFERRTALYKKTAVLDWLDRFPQKKYNSKANGSSPKIVFKRKIKPRGYEVFDNCMALQFLSYKLGKEQQKQFPGTGRTTVTHLVDINEHEIPNKNLSKQSNTGLIEYF